MARFIRIDDDTASAHFDVPRSGKRAYVELTLYGDCEPVLRHDPTSLENGRMVIHWDTNARSLPSGWYQLTVFVDKCPCSSFPVRVRNDCWAVFVDQEEYNSCYECDGLPKGKVKCCSTILKKDRCDPPICATPTDPRPQHYTPDYEET